jgi:FkbM family methyltransferase
MKMILKFAYKLIPFKKEMYNALKLFWTPKESIYKHLHFKGPFDVVINKTKKFIIYNNNSQIENEIFWEGLTGKWEKESLKLWINLCKNAQSIIDIGANTGVYSLAAKTVNPYAKVYAFEPHPLFFEQLRKNVKKNNFDIQCYQQAVSNVDGNLTIADYSGQKQNISVNSVTLNTFISQHKIDCVDLMKIDVETYEPQVMEGFSKYLLDFQPTIIIEILNNHVAEKIFNAVKNLNYLYFNINENGGIRQTKSIEKSDYYNYLLCKKDVALKLELV